MYLPKYFEESRCEVLYGLVHARPLATLVHTADGRVANRLPLERAIAGIGIPIERLVGRFKLGQNHPERHRRGGIAGLRRRGGVASATLAASMARCEEQAP